MIVHKVWRENKAKEFGLYPRWYKCEGYYLFGFILLYKKESPLN